MNTNLDEVDRKILKELQADGRASFRDVSSRIGVSTPTVSARVQAMSDMGLIRGYTTVLDADMLGQVSVVVILSVRPADINNVSQKLSDEEIVRQMFILSDSRLLLLVSYYNQAKYRQFMESLAKIDEISNVDTSMILRAPKELTRAAITDEAGLLIGCYYCGHLIHDEGVKLKIDGKYHYLCCDVCAKLYKDKYDKLKKSALYGI